MKTASPFLELESAPRVDVTWDGVPLSLPEEANLAAALLAAGVHVFRIHARFGRAPCSVLHDGGLLRLFG